MKLESASTITKKDDIAKEARAFMDDATAGKLRQLLDLDSGIPTEIPRSLGISLYLTDAPLTSQQAWDISKAYHDFAEKTDVSKDSDAEAVWNELRERIKPVLSPAQMPAFDEFKDQYVLVFDEIIKKEATKPETTKAQSK